MDKVSEIEQALEAAMNEVTALCKGEHGWRMCIPVQDTDSDVVISTALNGLRELLPVVTAARALVDVWDFIDYDRPSATYYCRYCEAVGTEDLVIHKDDCSVKALQDALGKLDAEAASQHAGEGGE